MTPSMIILAIALSLGLASLIISAYCEINTARKLKEAEYRLKTVEAERDAYEAASKAHLVEVDKFRAYKRGAANIECSAYSIIHTVSHSFKVIRRFCVDGELHNIAIKEFPYEKDDESDRLHALSEAEELLDALNDRVSWRISKDNGAIREDSRPSEEGKIQ